MEKSAETSSGFSILQAMASLLRRDVSFSSVTMENGLHQAAALASMSLLFTAHRSIMNIGFTMRRRGMSTDTYIVLIIGLVTITWTILVFISGFFLQDRPCLQGFQQCGARLAYAPWILIVLFAYWLVAFSYQVSYLRSKEVNAHELPPPWGLDAAEKQNSKNIMWQMECAHGPTNWAGSVRAWYRWTIYCTMLAVALTMAIASIMESRYTNGLLTIVGVILFITGASGKNGYASAPHIYTWDTLRVMLHTRHKQGTSYILPCPDRGFDAVWGPKMEYENKAIDEAIDTFQNNGGYAIGNVISLDRVLSYFNSSCDLTIHDIENLAEWLYKPCKNPQMCRIACKRAEGIHLINYELMSALCHAEYVVFQHLSDINPKLARQAALLRSSRGTGLNLDPDVSQKGKPSVTAGGKLTLENCGYQNAVKYVYKLLGEKVDPEALVPRSKCPTSSVILRPCPETIEEYVAQLWYHCFTAEESTFRALHTFTRYYQKDIGNDPKNGWHGFPLVAKDHSGDIVTWHIIWRQAWYGAIISQLTSMSPIIFSAFVAGVLQ